MNLILSGNKNMFHGKNITWELRCCIGVSCGATKTPQEPYNGTGYQSLTGERMHDCDCEKQS